MRYGKEQKAETRSRIVEVASRRFRGEGVDAVGVASLMADAGLTVGGFYAHFASKDALIAEAAGVGFEQTATRFRRYVLSKPKGQRLQAVIDAYLSARHRDAPEDGCTAAALGAEISRRPTAARAQFTQQLQFWVAYIEEALRLDDITADAQAIVSAMVGALILARAVDDPVLSDAYLESGRQAVMACVVSSCPLAASS